VCLPGGLHMLTSAQYVQQQARHWLSSLIHLKFLVQHI